MLMMPFGRDGGTQVTVTLRGCSPDTVGLSTGPGPADKKDDEEVRKVKDKHTLYLLIKE